MSAQQAYEAYEPIRSPESAPVTPEGSEAGDATILHLPPIPEEVGGVAVGTSVESDESSNESKVQLDLADIAASGMAVHLGSGGIRYFTRQTRTPSVGNDSHTRRVQAEKVHNRGGLL